MVTLTIRVNLLQKGFETFPTVDCNCTMSSGLWKTFSTFTSDHSHFISITLQLCFLAHGWQLLTRYLCVCSLATTGLKARVIFHLLHFANETYGTCKQRKPVGVTCAMAGPICCSSLLRCERRSHFIDSNSDSVIMSYGRKVTAALQKGGKKAGTSFLMAF